MWHVQGEGSVVKKTMRVTFGTLLGLRAMFSFHFHLQTQVRWLVSKERGESEWFDELG